MKKFIIGNWKMYPDKISAVYDFGKEILDLEFEPEKIKVAICPPAPFMFAIKEILSQGNISLGCQNHHSKDSGPYTGDYSAKMVASIGAEFSIIGHSERREAGEKANDITNKIVSALENGLIPIYCIGDNENNPDEAINFLKKQIKEEITDISASVYRRIIFAYEPLWAIGKNAVKTPDPTEIKIIIDQIRKFLNDQLGDPLAIIYGGSVDENNAKNFITDGGADGLLIGRASLDPVKFKKIINSINEL